MKKIYLLLLVFWWALIFPSLSINSFTTNLPKVDVCKDTFKNASYTFWLGKILLH